LTSFLKNNVKIDKKWSAITVIIVLLLGIPVFTILVKLIDGPGESWGHITKYLLSDYIFNSLYLIIACTIFTLILGVLSAWFVSSYDFPLRKMLQWLLILPLAVPNYLTAYAYAGIFDYNGTYERIVSYIIHNDSVWHIEIMSIWGLAFVLSISLYPYVYLAARSFFAYQSNTQIKAAQVLGASRFRTFRTIVLPLARPAIVGGLFLVLMEVLTDYGATYYYGVSTFTTAIFRSWFALGEPETAVYLSAILCLLIVFLIFLERVLRGKKRYNSKGDNAQPLERKPLNAKFRLIFVFLAFTPVLLGFAAPVAQMLYWASFTAREVWSSGFLDLMGTSLYLSFIAAFICIMVSIFLIYGAIWSRSKTIANFSKVTILGYAVPGVVIAVGVMIPTLIFDKSLINFTSQYFGWSMGLLINGSIIGLLFAYLVRFLAVAYNPIEASVTKTGSTFEQVAQVLGIKRWKRMLQINVPLNRMGLISGGILVFVDVMKELPLTLLLKPYGIMTLSVKAFEYASDERIAESALPALFIIATGLIPIILLNRLINA
jgi:iron(III) transport system permease protein